MLFRSVHVHRQRPRFERERYQESERGERKNYGDSCTLHGETGLRNRSAPTLGKTRKPCSDRIHRKACRRIATFHRYVACVADVRLGFEQPDVQREVFFEVSGSPKQSPPPGWSRRRLALAVSLCGQFAMIGAADCTPKTKRYKR